ncbi:MAG: tRNA (adenosine(37)-N6)-dimethylallyltransferase MiaA [Magnetococcales bacterium]|nr:tRNA (adenosine(37)-N6)-dimethylallyltransferase MiaA [Magnetococcales bacterium]
MRWVCRGGQFLNNALLVILGPTASGKTRLGVALARYMTARDGRGWEILSADSRQVFRGMDIGTGKDLAEYGSLPYHLIDICDPGYSFSVYEFQHRFYQAVADIQGRGRLPMLVGGSGLYLDAAVRGYLLQPVAENPALRAELAGWAWADLEARLRRLRPALHNRTDLDCRERLVRAIEIAEGSANQAPRPAPPLTPFIMGIRWERSLLRQRITARLEARLQAGLLAEVEGLLGGGLAMERLAAYGLEYRFACRYLAGELSWEAFFAGLNRAIHQFAKRQETWFRHMERQGVVIHWLDGAADPLEAAVACLQREKFLP